MTKTVTVFYEIILANTETCNFLYIIKMYKDNNFSEFIQLGVSCKIINMSSQDEDRNSKSLVRKAIIEKFKYTFQSFQTEKSRS